VNDPEVSGPDLFSRLVPLGALEKANERVSLCPKTTLSSITSTGTLIDTGTITEEQPAPAPAPSRFCNFCLADIVDSDLLSHIHCTAVLCRECLDSSLRASPGQCLVCFKRCTPSEWVQVERKKTSVKKSQKRKNKKKSKKDPTLGNTSQTEVLQPSKEALDKKKVKVKAELRSKISELELAEEAGKLKITTDIEEENAKSSAIESKIKVALERRGHLRAKVDDVDSEIERLLGEKRSVEKEQEEVEKEVAEMEKKKEVSKEAFALDIKQQREELEQVQEELENVRKELDLAEGRPQGNNDLEKFMVRQIEELEEELVCPVCLEVTTTAPIYKCSDDHLICRECRPKLKACPQCRVDYPKEWKRFRVAEKQGEKLEALLKEKLAISQKKL